MTAKEQIFQEAINLPWTFPFTIFFMKSSLKVKDKEILEKSENEEVAKEKTVKLYVRSLEDKPNLDFIKTTYDITLDSYSRFGTSTISLSFTSFLLLC